ncbi:hypothetical protein DPMN_045234 [Dreissena polymorpha]|uniref:Uncharacterized protein n=1 Tax=Dreissena polymorpha TaxID=45954 RepID=A0A9D4I172_DREPO|nr:hypothetical protein DPMN_045234 [Dreissena polymorpha]
MFVSCVLCPREASRSRSLTIGRRLRELFVEPVLGGSLMGLLVNNILSLEIAEVAKDIIFGPQRYWYHPWTGLRPST